MLDFLAAFCPPPSAMMKAVSGKAGRRFSLPRLQPWDVVESGGGLDRRVDR